MRLSNRLWELVILAMLSPWVMLIVFVLGLAWIACEVAECWSDLEKYQLRVKLASSWDSPRVVQVSQNGAEEDFEVSVAEPVEATVSEEAAIDPAENQSIDREIVIADFAKEIRERVLSSTEFLQGQAIPISRAEMKTWFGKVDPALLQQLYFELRGALGYCFYVSPPKARSRHVFYIRMKEEGLYNDTQKPKLRQPEL